MSGEWARNCPQAIVVSIMPDVCWTPFNGTMVAVPYMIFARLSTAENTEPMHLIGGYETFTTASRIPHVEGNEAGTGGGIMSGVNRGYCRAIEHSTTSRIGADKWLVREGDLFAMNCAGPDGPPNTYGRLIIMNYVAAAPSVTIASETKSVVDDATGKTIVERFESTVNPDTGATTTMRERSAYDPKTGQAEVHRVEVTTHPDGRRSYKASAGAFDPDTDSFAWKTSTGDLPSDANVELDDVALNDDGRLYLHDGDESYVPSAKLDEHDDIPDDDPDVLNDPDVIAAKEGEAACRAELDAAKSQLAWEGLKAAVDVGGIVDPTPTADLVGAGMALSDGEWLDAGLSVISAVIPYGGDAIAKGFKGARVTKRIGNIQRWIRKLDKLLAEWQHSIEQATKIAKGKKKAAAENLPGFSRPKNPGDGGFAPDLKAASAKKPKIEIKSPNACRDALRKNLSPKPTNMVDPHAHHDLPVKFQDKFAERGIDINAAEHGRWVEQKPHSSWSGKFNREWEEFFKRKPRATHDEIIQFRDAIRSKYQ